MLVLMTMTACVFWIFYSHGSVETLSQENTEMMTMQMLESTTRSLELMTYNIRHGVGIDDQLNLERVIETIKGVDPDIVALNEVDHRMPRSRMQKQDEIIAEKLGYYVAYGYNINFGLKYGNALLTKYPIKSWTNHHLPSLERKITEPRGLIEAELDIDGQDVKVFITHLSLITEERPEQIDFIVGKLKEISKPAILMGDFNDCPSSEQMGKISAIMQDTAGQEEYNTFSTDRPEARIDYIFVSKDMAVGSSKTVPSDASDHLPVVAEISFNH